MQGGRGAAATLGCTLAAIVSCKFLLVDRQEKRRSKCRGGVLFRNRNGLELGNGMSGGRGEFIPREVVRAYVVCAWTAAASAWAGRGEHMNE